MIPTTPDDLKQLLSILRDGGVSAYEAGQFKVSLHPTQPKAEPMAELEDKACNCGHPDYDHGPGGLCIHGCEPEKCLGKVNE